MIFCLKIVIDHWVLVHLPPHGWLTTTKFIQIVMFVTPAAVHTDTTTIALLTMVREVIL